jgi:hypothetical protein
MPPAEPQPPMEQTEYGWAVVSEKMPRRGEGHLWLKIPERHIYDFDGDGWYRIQPPEDHFVPLNHG